MKNQHSPKQTRLTALEGGRKEDPFAESFGLDLEGAIVHRKDGSFDSKASGAKLLDSLHTGPIDVIAHRLAWWIYTTDRSGWVRTSRMIGWVYDLLCAYVPGFDEMYYRVLRAKTPLDWARINKMPAAQFTLRLGYSLTDKPSFIARTIKSRHALHVLPELRELVAHLRNDDNRTCAYGPRPTSRLTPCVGSAQRESYFVHPRFVSGCVEPTEC